MMKEELLKLILEFVERKGKMWFSRDEFLVWLWFRKRNISFESVSRKLRLLARQGFLAKRYVRVEEWGFARKVYYFPIKYNIYKYLMRGRRKLVNAVQ